MKTTFITIIHVLMLLMVFSCNTENPNEPIQSDTTPKEQDEPIVEKKTYIIPTGASEMKIKGSPKYIEEVAYKWNSAEQNKGLALSSTSYTFNEKGYLLESTDTLMDGIYRSEYKINYEEGSVLISRSNLEYDVGYSERKSFYKESGLLDSVFNHFDEDRDYFEKYSYDENEKLAEVKRVYIKTKSSNLETTLSTYTYSDSSIITEFVNLSNNEDFTLKEMYNTKGDCSIYIKDDGGIVDIVEYSYEYDHLQNWVVKKIILDGEIWQIIERKFIYF